MLLVEFEIDEFFIVVLALEIFAIVALVSDEFDERVVLVAFDELVVLVVFVEFDTADDEYEDGTVSGPLSEKTAGTCVIREISDLKIPRKAYSIDIAAMIPIENIRKCMKTLISFAP